MRRLAAALGWGVVEKIRGLTPPYHPPRSGGCATALQSFASSTRAPDKRFAADAGLPHAVSDVAPLSPGFGWFAWRVTMGDQGLDEAMRSMAIAAARITAMGLAIGFVAGDGPALARRLPELPPPIGQVLGQLGINTDAGVSGLFGNWHAAFRPPVKNPELVEVMEQARTGDVVLPLDHPLFAPETAEVGHWHSQFFVSTYGTALFLSAPFDPERIPVVLVPGINGSARDFAQLVQHVDRSRYQALYFVYPSGMALGGASRQLGTRLREFVGRHPVDRFAVIAHSMGGLVAAGVLEQVDVADALPGWRTLIAISSPFAGVETAEYAERLPQHPPAWDDLAGRSAFLTKLYATRFPRTLDFYLFFGARSSRRLLSTLGNNDGVLTLEAVVGSPMSESARDVFGFYEDHMSILAAPLVFRRLDQILAAELGG